MKKFILIFICFAMSISPAFAQLSNLRQKQQDTIAFCYGVYDSLKGIQEREKNNAFLEAMDHTYTKIKANPNYTEGKMQSKTLDKKTRRNCYSMIYGFFVPVYALAGKKPSEDTSNIAYCLGYYAEATDDEESMMRMGCQTDEKEQPATEEMQARCINKNMQNANKVELYKKGKMDAQNADALDVLSCIKLLSKASSEELGKAMNLQ